MRISHKHFATAMAALLCFGSAMAGSRKFNVNLTPDGKARMQVCLPDKDKATGRAVVICPGGGYAGLAIENEGTNWIDFFNNKGIACMILTYRMPHGDRNLPIADAENAMLTVRDSAEVWNINPYDIGIMGSSAGGHLASTIACHAALAARPNFQILFYPVITMDERKTHVGSVHNFLGEGRNDPELVRKYSNELQIRRHATPPALLLLTTDDTLVPPVTNGIAYFAALRNAHIQAALYSYDVGEHGFGSHTHFVYHKQLLTDMENWLDNLKAPKYNAIRVACIGNSITDGDGIDMSNRDAYPGRLQQMLGENYNVRNFGVSARTVLQNGDHPYVNEQAWRDAKDFEPNVVVVKLGTNDSKPHNWVHKADFEKDLESMVGNLKNLKSKPDIWLALPTKTWDNRAGIRDSVINNEIIPIIQQVAKKFKVGTIDLHTPFENDRSLVQQDGIHPNKKGAEHMAKIIADTIRQNR